MCMCVPWNTCGWMSGRLGEVCFLILHPCEFRDQCRSSGFTANTLTCSATSLALAYFLLFWTKLDFDLQNWIFKNTYLLCVHVCMYRIMQVKVRWHLLLCVSLCGGTCVTPCKWRSEKHYSVCLCVCMCAYVSYDVSDGQRNLILCVHVNVCVHVTLCKWRKHYCVSVCVHVSICVIPCKWRSEETLLHVSVCMHVCIRVTPCRWRSEEPCRSHLHHVCFGDLYEEQV